MEVDNLVEPRSCEIALIVYLYFTTFSPLDSQHTRGRIWNKQSVITYISWDQRYLGPGVSRLV